MASSDDPTTVGSNMYWSPGSRKYGRSMLGTKPSFCASCHEPTFCLWQDHTGGEAGLQAVVDQGGEGVALVAVVGVGFDADQVARRTRRMRRRRR